MPYVIVCGTALVVSALTMLSGFGLGTLLLPAFLVFFPPEAAVAATALVHLLNNLFKYFLVGKYADRSVVVRFALPAAFFAVAGAFLLTEVSQLSLQLSYTIFGRVMVIAPINVLIAVLMVVFGLFQLLPKFQRVSFDRKYIPVGGALSGFFGGISGHQGALRAAFLIRAGLTKNCFIGTSVLSAIVVDFARIVVYGYSLYSKKFMLIHEGSGLGLLAAATAAAFAGSYTGSRLMKKVSHRVVHYIVGTMLLLLAVVFGLGFFNS